MIRLIVGQCHVSDTNREVIRYLISKLKGGMAGWRAMPREKRRAVMVECIREHRENLELYVSVMRGQG